MLFTFDAEIWEDNFVNPYEFLEFAIVTNIK